MFVVHLKFNSRVTPVQRDELASVVNRTANVKQVVHDKLKAIKSDIKQKARICSTLILTFSARSSMLRVLSVEIFDLISIPESRLFKRALLVFRSAIPQQSNRWVVNTRRHSYQPPCWFVNTQPRFHALAPNGGCGCFYMLISAIISVFLKKSLKTLAVSRELSLPHLGGKSAIRCSKVVRILRG